MGFDARIKDYVDDEILNAVATLLSAPGGTQLLKAADVIAQTFGASSSLFSSEKADFEEKLISSFQKNLTLLIQKTWVEKADAELKENVLYKLSEFCKQTPSDSWNHLYQTFLQIINDVVYLMFGNQSKTEDFAEYALRIDPEFGIFCFYIRNLPEETEWPNEKCRVVILLGMYFLANY